MHKTAEYGTQERKEIGGEGEGLQWVSNLAEN